MNYNRFLVPTEQAMEVLNRHQGSFNVVTISRIKGVVNQDTLRQTLDIIQSINPRLGSRIIGELDKLEFVNEGTEKIPLRIINYTQEGDWQNIVTTELNHSIYSQKCLLKCTLLVKENELEKNYLITTIHHAISDGLSCITLQSEILKYYQIIASGNPVHCQPKNTLPPVDELLPQSMQGTRGNTKRMLFLLKTQLKTLLHNPERLESEKAVPIELRSCGMTQRCLEKELTRKLVKLSRQEQITVHGAICAAMLMAVANRIRLGKSRNINVSCRSYINLRKRLEPVISNDNMGILASFLTSFHTIKPQTSFWELAREVNQKITLGLNRKDIFKPLSLFRKIVEFSIKKPDESFLTASVTNVGIVNIPRHYGDLELEEISFVPSNVIFGRVFTVAVTTFEEKMTLNFLVSKPSISQETMEELASDVISCLSEVCQAVKD